MITISACMIVKNEEKLLKRAISCFIGFADEIIIVDTGSTDKTKAIAREYTDKVYDFEWRDDFSDARNYAASKAVMDYIYCADADEVIDKANQRAFLLLKGALDSEIDIVQMRYSNQLRFGTTYNFDVEYRSKLYKRFHEVRWKDPIHEVLDPKLRVFNSEIVITHMPEKMHGARDLAIFRNVGTPGNLLSIRLHRLYARELFFAGSDEDFLLSYDYFEWTLHEQSAAEDHVRASQCVIAKCANLKNDSETLFAVCLKNIIGKPGAEICCELGDYYMRKENFEEAATWYYTAAFGAESEFNIRCSGDLPLQKLSECCLKLGEPDESLNYKKQAAEWASKWIARSPDAP